LIILGLDNAGKTTVASAIKGTITCEISPTWGLNQDELALGKIPVKFYDVGGGARIRGIWSHYLAEVHGIVVVVDSADPARLEEARDVLAQSLSDKAAAGKPVLLLANKQDQEGAASPTEVAARLNLGGSGRDSGVHVVGAVATGVKGKADPRIAAGIRWLLGMVRRDARLRERVEREAEEQLEAERRRREERRQRRLEEDA